MVDVGSNIGIFGVQAGQIVGSTGRVISIEALPPTFEKLQQNREATLRQGQVSAEWTAINAAAGASDGQIEMTFFPRAAGWGTSNPEHHRERMKSDLSVFIRSLLQDKSSKVRIHCDPQLASPGCAPTITRPMATITRPMAHHDHADLQHILSSIRSWAAQSIRYIVQLHPGAVHIVDGSSINNVHRAMPHTDIHIPGS